ncbi:hypothetical protein EON82_13505 [bacterium]|nr:MAG: hypothetical protein EON82_13505 [bacterium]
MFGLLTAALIAPPAPTQLAKLGSLEISIRSMVRAPQGNGVYLSVYDRVPGGKVGLKALGPDLQTGRDYAAWTEQPSGGKEGEDTGFALAAGKAVFTCGAFLQTQVKSTDLASGKTAITVFDNVQHHFIGRPPLAMQGGRTLLVPGNSILQPLDLQTMKYGENMDLGQAFGSMLPLDDDTVLISTFDNADKNTFLIRKNLATGETKYVRTPVSMCSMKADRGFIAAVAKAGIGTYRVYKVDPTSLALAPLTEPFKSTSTPAFAVRGGAKPLLALGDCGTVVFGLWSTRGYAGHGTRVLDLKSGRLYIANELATDMTVSADGSTLYAKRSSLGVTSFRLP